MHLADTFIEEFDTKINRLKRITNHGPSLGRYIELLLLNLLTKYFPQSLSYSSGFVQGMDPSLERSISSQIDILCYDRFDYPIAFHSEEFVVVTPSSVRGIIEVKTTLNTKAIQDLIKLSESTVLTEVPFQTKIYLIATQSRVTAKKAFETLRSHYLNKDISVVRLIGGIYSLDWDSRINCNVYVNDAGINYHLRWGENVKVGIAPFFLDLLLDLFGRDKAAAIANITASTLNVQLDSVLITGKLSQLAES